MYKAREGEHLKERIGMRDSNRSRERETSGKGKAHTKEKAENCLVNSVPPPSFQLPMYAIAD
jgi:hypothetical protein